MRVCCCCCCCCWRLRLCTFFKKKSTLEFGELRWRRSAVWFVPQGWVYGEQIRMTACDEVHTCVSVHVCGFFLYQNPTRMLDVNLNWVLVYPCQAPWASVRESVTNNDSGTFHCVVHCCEILLWYAQSQWIRDGAASAAHESSHSLLSALFARVSKSNTTGILDNFGFRS